MSLRLSSKFQIGSTILCVFTAVGCFPDWDFGPQEPLPSAWDAGREDADSASIAVTIAAYNVENFDLGGDAEGQYSYVAAFAASAGVDILVLEEVQKDANGDDEALFSAALADAKYPMPYVGFSSMSDGFNAIAVWSRFPLLNFEEILPENTRTVYRFTADIEGEPLLLFACHLKSGDDAASAETRAEEANRIGAYIAAYTDPVSQSIVLLGDMNTMSNADFEVPGTLAYLRLTSLYDTNPDDDFTPVTLTDGDTFATYPATGSLLDYILLSPGALSRYVSDSATIPAPAGDGPFGPSDHYPVQIELAM